MFSRLRFPSALFLAATLVVTGEATAQPLTYRTPNIGGTWVTSPWNLYFSFNHRFRIAGDKDITDIFDEGKVTNSPTFNLALGLWPPVMAGVMYMTNPSIRNDLRTNEWFPYVKVAPWRRETWSVSVLGGYNSQAESLDGVLAGQTTIGRLELLGEARGFTDALHTGEGGLALAGGLGFRLSDFLTLAGDVGGLVAGPDTGVAWSAGLQLAIPYTPHTFSLQASNSAGTTPQEASFNGFGDDVAWGFEFTVPFSGFARWGRIFDNDGPGAAGAAAATGVPAEPRRVVEVDIREFKFQADTVRVEVGGTVRWINRDALAHTSTADDGAWESPLIGPGETFTKRFVEVGTFPYHCTPHPFMRGVVIVEPRDGG